MANKELIFQNVARDLGTGQFFALKLIDGGTVYTMYLEELTQPPRQPAVASQILATGVPIIAPSGAGDVIGIGTTGNLPLWTDGPNSVIGDSVLTQSGGNLIQPTGNLTLTAGNIVVTVGNLTLSAGRASIVPAVNTSPLTVSGYSLTGANTQPVLDLSGTWNTSGAATGIKLNITNTASGAALLMDLQIGSISQFSVSKAGVLAFTGAIAFPDGVRQTFNPDATTPGFNVGSQAGDPSTPSNGDLWYDSTGNLLRARIGGSTISIGTGTVPFALTGVSATALTVAAAGTDYQLQVDTSVASAVTGLKITGAASGAGITLSAISSGAAEPIIFAPKAATASTLTLSWSSTVGGTTGLVLNANDANATTGLGFRTKSNGRIGIFTAAPTDTNSVIQLWNGNLGGMAQTTGGLYAWTDSATNADSTRDTSLNRVSAGIVGIGTGASGFAGSLKLTNLLIGTLGGGVQVKEGANATMGTGTLNGTTEVTISTTKVTATSRIFLSIQAPGGTPLGVIYVSSRIAGTSFGVKGAATDTSDFAWWIVEPAA